MSGVEAGSLVVGIIALFPALRNLWIEWKASRKGKKMPPDEAKLVRLDQSLSLSGPAIECEYASHLKALGKRFQVGDGMLSVFSLPTVIREGAGGSLSKTETAQLALSKIKLAQQESLITVLSQALLSRDTHVGCFDISSLHASSERVRRDTIAAMSDLHQRLAVKQGPSMGVVHALPLPPFGHRPFYNETKIRRPQESEVKSFGKAERDKPDDNSDCEADGYRRCPHTSESGFLDLTKARCPRCKVKLESSSSSSQLVLRISGNVCLSWGKILMLSHLVCQCYGSLSKNELRFACILCHAMTDLKVFKGGEVQCQKGLYRHMSRDHKRQVTCATIS